VQHRGGNAIIGRSERSIIATYRQHEPEDWRGHSDEHAIGDNDNDNWKERPEPTGACGCIRNLKP
jgi:hypothetical protein